MDLEMEPDWASAGELAATVLAGDADPWRALRGAGVADLGTGEVLAVLTEVGRAAAPVPALARLACAALPLARLSDVDTEATAALHEQGVAFPAVPATRAVDGRLTGTKTAVPWLDGAGLLLVPATEDGAAALYAVQPGADGVTVRDGYGAGGVPVCTVHLDGARARRLGGPDAVARLYTCARAGLLATADGVLAGALALTRDHVAGREQFGRPLAAFQAVAGQIGDVYVAARTLRLVAQAVGWRLATGRDPGEDLDIGLYWLCAELLPALHTCQHLHGGLGVDASYPLHRYYALGKDLVHLAGGPHAATGTLGDRIAEVA